MVSFEELGKELGRDEVYVASIFYGQVRQIVPSRRKRMLTFLIGQADPGRYWEASPESQSALELSRVWVRPSVLPGPRRPYVPSTNWSRALSSVWNRASLWIPHQGSDSWKGKNGQHQIQALSPLVCSLVMESCLLSTLQQVWKR